MLDAPGVTEIETKAADVTVSIVLPDTPLVVAVIVEEPAANAVASPAVLMVAIFALAELQLTLLVRSCLLPSL